MNANDTNANGQLAFVSLVPICIISIMPTAQSHNLSFGKWGEDQAVLFLKRQGFNIIDRNFHTTQGEIDIVATKGGDFYFIEVKTRSTGELATDLAITKTKKHKLDKTIKSYLYRKNITEGSFIPAGLIVHADRRTKKVTLRFAVYC